MAAYVNFFTERYTADLRLVLFAAAAVIFGRSVIHYRVWRHRAMPLLLGLGLVAAFIWAAENIATFAQAGAYPHQHSVWKPVHMSKLGAWFLLMPISYGMVAAIHGVGPYLKVQAAGLRQKRSA